MPNGKTIQSTHTCHLDIPWLPAHMTEAHIVPGLTHASLISTRKFCDAGCQVVFDRHECRVYYKGQLVLTGDRDPSTSLWRLPINPTRARENTADDLHRPIIQGTKHNTTISTYDAAFNVYTIPHKQNQLKYIHQSFFSPPLPTLIKAIRNDQLTTVPFMKEATVMRHLAKAPATSKGRMKLRRQGIRSTRKQSAIIANDSDDEPIPPSPAHLIPPDETHAVNNVFCYAALADKQRGTLYTDATGALPAISLDGHQYYFVAYDYDTNFIFAEPVKDLTDDSIMHAFDKIFSGLEQKGFKPTFNVSDNQAAKRIKAYLTNERTRWQFVEPHNHRVNAAERAIQTFKSHFISGLCSIDPEWPIQLWDRLTEQAIITLNLLRTSRIDPTKSAYHQYYGHKYDWNKL